MNSNKRRPEGRLEKAMDFHFALHATEKLT